MENIVKMQCVCSHCLQWSLVVQVVAGVVQSGSYVGAPTANIDGRNHCKSGSSEIIGMWFNNYVPMLLGCIFNGSISTGGLA